MKATAIIKLSSLRHNLELLKSYYPRSRVVAMIKSDAYGHGLLNIATELDKHLHSSNVLAVKDIDSAVQLRKILPHRRITLLHGVDDLPSAMLCLHHRLEMVIHHISQIRLLQQLEKKLSSKKDQLKPLLLWIKTDTGMNRLGFKHEELKQVDDLLNSLDLFESHCLMTHLASADQPYALQNKQQLSEYARQKSMVNTIPYTSVSNSAGIINHLIEDSPLNYVRPGIMLYGVSPHQKENFQAIDQQLKPVMSLYAPVISVKKIYQGESVGYGGTKKALENGHIAILKIGYGEGYPRGLSNQGKVYINGNYYPIIGRVSMDLTVIDISISATNRSQKVAVGDMAEIWGVHVSVSDLAEKMDTIAYELLTQIKVKKKVLE